MGAATGAGAAWLGMGMRLMAPNVHWFTNGCAAISRCMVTKSRRAAAMAAAEFGGGGVQLAPRFGGAGGGGGGAKKAGRLGLGTWWRGCEREESPDKK